MTKPNKLLILTILFAGILSAVLISFQIALDHHVSNERQKDAQLARDSVVIDSLQFTSDSLFVNHSEIR